MPMPPQPPFNDDRRIKSEIDRFERDRRSRIRLTVSKSTPIIGEQITFTVNVSHMNLDLSVDPIQDAWFDLTCLEGDAILIHTGNWKKTEDDGHYSWTDTYTREMTLTYYVEFTPPPPPQPYSLLLGSKSDPVTVSVQKIPTTLTLREVRYTSDSPYATMERSTCFLEGNLRGPDGSGISDELIMICDENGSPYPPWPPHVTATTAYDGYYTIGHMRCARVKAHFAGDSTHSEAWSPLATG